MTDTAGNRKERLNQALILPSTGNKLRPFGKPESMHNKDRTFAVVSVFRSVEDVLA